ncbi:dATP/dGTP diphosphohydrolase domain-containing protein [Amycolatopsis lexingtonensis]|uniref:dATP/dGTP diphosphohydrolase domain-containing protein n=1 Tax=Amycolatopsis lexingtonensis TaxID=218822 RepID=UPI003F6F895B
MPTEEYRRRARFVTKDSGERAQFRGGGQRDSEKGKPRFDLVFPKRVPYEDQMITRLAALMGRGAEKYADRNWELFADQPALDRAKSSALRHFMQWVNGETDEDHAAAVMFNIIAAEFIKGRLEDKW